MDFDTEHRRAVQAQVARLLRRGVGDPDVEDVTGEVFRRALESAPSLRKDEPLRPWLLGIARFAALDFLRASYRRRGRQELAATLEGVERFEASPDRSPDPEQLAEGRQRLRRLGALLETCPAQQREVLLLFHVEGLGYREIAERLQVPIGSVGTWIQRSRQTFLQEFAEAVPLSDSKDRCHP